MKPYSLDLRARIVAAYDRKEGSQADIARRFDVSRSFVEKLLRRRRETHALDAKPHTGGRRARLDAAGRATLRQMLLDTNDLTLEEVREQLASRLSVQLSRSRLCRIVQQLDLPRKKSRFTPKNARHSA